MFITASMDHITHETLTISTTLDILITRFETTYHFACYFYAILLVFLCCFIAIIPKNKQRNSK